MKQDWHHGDGKEKVGGAFRRQTLFGYGRMVVKNHERIADCCGFTNKMCEECNVFWNLLCWAAMSYANEANCLLFKVDYVQNIQVKQHVDGAFGVRFSTKNNLLSDIEFSTEAMAFFLSQDSP